MIDISVIIPAYRRPDLLMANISKFEKIGFPRDRFEIIVAADEYNDDLKNKIMGRKLALRLVYAETEHQGIPAAANYGAKLSAGGYLLFISQDVIPDVNLLYSHFEMMGKYTGKKVILTGYTPYPGYLQKDDFHNYLMNSTPQFAYNTMSHGMALSGEYLCFINCFIRRSDFIDMGGFDSSFKFGCADADFGIRWQKSGGEIIYNNNAVGQYDNHSVVKLYCEKQILIGRSTFNLHRKHSDYFASKREFIQERVNEHFLLKNESEIEHLLANIKLFRSEKIFDEVVKFYFWKGYYIESCSEAPVQV